MALVVRSEPWGRISYDDVDDEFTAQVAPGGTPKPSMPIAAGWVIIGACDLECFHCYGNAEELPKATLSTEDSLKVVGVLKEAGIMRVVISGGEPMLRHDLPEIVSSFRANRIAVVLGTNGTYIDEARVEMLLQCNRVEISLDGATQATHDLIRPSRGRRRSSWQSTWNALRVCVANGVAVRVLTTLNSLNEGQILAMAEILAAGGIDDWAISWTIPAGRARATYEALRPRGTRIQETVDLARERFPNMGIRYSERGRDFTRFYFLLLPDGRIATEDANAGGKVSFGSVLDVPISSVWTEANFNLDGHFEKWVGDRTSNLVE